MGRWFKMDETNTVNATFYAVKNITDENGNRIPLRNWRQSAAFSAVLEQNWKYNEENISVTMLIISVEPGKWI
jgi:hypothetical protein